MDKLLFKCDIHDREAIDRLHKCSSIDTEDIIFYILNGLPANYQAFKSAIRIKLTPISLDDLYSLLCSEEVNLATDAAKELHIIEPTSAQDNHFALTSTRGRGRGHCCRACGHSSFYAPSRFSTCSSPMLHTTTPRLLVDCQICRNEDILLSTIGTVPTFNSLPRLLTPIKLYLLKQPPSIPGTWMVKPLHI
ncbi:hypothetical protein M5K25_003718 [Dendrobium thyrsiflorum]|uniref:Retrovirus-related Pol polyprotein from transposon TNT 1-94 n=1 Tax=Dendrobium thyrsiflorum TaxID=117978 RepID=A0ABD0VRT1_DENTH